MAKILFFLLLPMFAASQRTFYAGAVGSISARAYGIEAGFNEDEENKVISQLNLTVLRPMVPTGEQLHKSGEYWIPYKAPILVTFGLDILVIGDHVEDDDDYGGLLLGAGHGWFPEHAYVQVGWVLKVKGCMLKAAYRYGAAEYKALSGFYLTIGFLKRKGGY